MTYYDPDSFHCYYCFLISLLMLFFSVLLYANMLLQHVFAHGVLYSEFLNNTRNFVFLISLKFCLRIGVDCFLLDLVPRFKFVGLYVFILFGHHTFRFVAPNLPISHHLRPPPAASASAAAAAAARPKSAPAHSSSPLLPLLFC